MSQHDMDVANGAGVVVRADINAALQALASSSSGSSAPSPSFPCQLWADTGTSRLKRRNLANSAWLDEGPLDAALRDAASQGEFISDTGAENAYVCNFVPALTVRSESTPLRFKVANANTTASTINDGIGTVSLVGAAHAALQGGELIANGIAWIQWNTSVGGGSYVLLFCTGAPQQVTDATKSKHAVTAGQVVQQTLTAFTTAGTAAALTLTPIPAITAYSSPLRFRVKFSQASTGTDTINVSTLGAKSIKQYDYTGAKVAAVYAVGQLADIEYDGTDFVMLDALPANVALAQSGIVGGARNLKMSVTAAAATANITADEVVIEVGAFGALQYRLSGLSKSINLATTGVGGMDTGSAPVSGFVGIYAIYNPSAPLSSTNPALLAQNATSSLLSNIYAGANMPAGYTASALISVWPTNGSGQFVIGYQDGRDISIVPVSVLNATSLAASLTSLSIAGAVPRNARRVQGYLNIGCSGGSGGLTSKVASDANGSGFASVGGYTSSSPSIGVQGVFSLALITQQTIFRSETASGAPTGLIINLNISGYSI